MSCERTEQALARIDAALARIQKAATQAETAAGEQARRHDVLRQAVAETMRDLDILIKGQSEGFAS